ncbi:MAG: tetratricopeptide repeat protein [Ardenticatenaceae bacterium]
MDIFIRFSDDDELVLALEDEEENEHELLLIEIPRSNAANFLDRVRYDPASAREEPGGISYLMEEVVDPSDYRCYLTWAILHRPTDFLAWIDKIEETNILLFPADWIANSLVRRLQVAIPGSVSDLEALVTFNRHARTVEIVCPLLAAHANDLERAKSDLERAIAWGANDAELTYALAEAFEGQRQWDAAMPFWERLAHILPDVADAHERLAINYARLDVYSLAASEFDRAAYLTDDPAQRERLEAARDLMWERSKL